MKQKVLEALLVSVVSLLSSCTRVGSDPYISTPEHAVSIVAELSNADTGTRRYLRASEGSVESNSDDQWQENAEAALEAEKTIQHIFLFVYKKGQAVPSKVYFYYLNGKTNPLGASDGFEAEVRTIDSDALSGTSIRMNLELEPGNYNFVLLVNSTAALNEMKTKKFISRPELLKEESSVFTSDDLTGSDRKYMTMVGQNELTVPVLSSGDNDRKLLTPSILLERVHARVEVLLSTSNGPDYLSPILSETKIIGMELVNEHKSYTVMPSAQDYTATAKSNSSKIVAPVWTTDVPTYGRGVLDSDELGVPTIDGGYVDKFKDKLLPYIYTVPYTGATQESQTLTLKLFVRFPVDSEDTVYTIPLTNPNATGMAKYVTRRNTIYRVRAKLHGRDLHLFNYEIQEWTNQNVDIPW